MITKVCNVCNLEKPLNDFPKCYKNEKIYYRGLCKKCKNELEKERVKNIGKTQNIKTKNKLTIEEQKEYRKKRDRLYYQNNKEKVIERVRKYQNEHKKERKNYNKEYYQKNKNKLKQQAKQYYEKNKEDRKLYRKQYYEKNKDKIKSNYAQNINNVKRHRKEKYEKNKDVVLKQSKQYYESHKKEILMRHKEYTLKNKIKIRERQNKYNRIYEKERKSKDIIFKLKKQLKTCIRYSFIRKGMNKSKHTEEIVGIPLDELYLYLLDTFEKNYGYKWDGKEEVHIDHIKPLSTANTEEDVIKLCHYTNLQLLKGVDNLDKKDKLDWTLKNFN